MAQPQPSSTTVRGPDPLRASPEWEGLIRGAAHLGQVSPASFPPAVRQSRRAEATLGPEGQRVSAACAFRSPSTQEGLLVSAVITAGEAAKVTASDRGPQIQGRSSSKGQKQLFGANK